MHCAVILSRKEKCWPMYDPVGINHSAIHITTCKVMCVIQSDMKKC